VPLRGRGHSALGGLPQPHTPAAPEETVTFDDRFPELYLVALRPGHWILQNRSDAEDIAAETMARLYERWDRLSKRQELPAWVARVATNLALDRVKRRTPGPAIQQQGADVSDYVVARMQLAKAVHALPRRQRDVIALKYFADLPDAEVAAILRISQATERTHLRRALAALRPQFDL
jgi:RNA polymerase sigma factor (sigma-70 family)